MFIFSEENNKVLPPVQFHHHFPFHTLNVTVISVKLNRMQCKQSDFVPLFTTISNHGAFNHYASSAYEPN